MDEEELYFDKFWNASSLDRFNVQEFARQFSNYDNDDKELYLEFPGKTVALPKINTGLNKISKKRKSDRVFSGKEMSVKDLSRLLSSLRALNDVEHRAYPSAGATYVTEAFVVTFNVKGMSGKILYYDSETHGTVTISEKAPKWEEAAKALNITVTGIPNLIVILTILPKRAISKYGERGGRFALFEMGAAMQQLSLQVAGSAKLKGVIAGGMLDRYWLDTLGLDSSDARIGVGYLIGQ